MPRRSIRCLLVAMAASPALGSGPPETVAPVGGGSGASEGQALSERLDRIEARLQRLEADPGGRWLADHRAEEVRALVLDVLADAETRASLQRTRPVAGYDEGVFFTTPDRDVYVRLTGQIQHRYVWNRITDEPRDDTRTGFEVRRLKLKVRGHILQYVVNSKEGVGADKEVAQLWLKLIETTAYFLNEILLPNLHGSNAAGQTLEPTADRAAQLADSAFCLQGAPQGHSGNCR